ncbi:MAG: DUF2975 domain-containing protein [Hyphomonas sp.]
MESQNLLSDGTRLTCRILKWLAVAIAGAIAVIFFATDASTLIVDAAWNGLQDNVREAVTYSSGKKWLLHGLASIGYFSLLLIVFGAVRVFAVFQKGAAFSVPAVRAVRFFGLMIVLYAATRLVMPTLIVLGLTLDNDDGLRALTIAVDMSEITLLIVGAVILVIGQILTQAVGIARENDQFI